MAAFQYLLVRLAIAVKNTIAMKTLRKENISLGMADSAIGFSPFL